jgi:hypothetical protein
VQMAAGVRCGRSRASFNEVSLGLDPDQPAGGGGVDSPESVVANSPSAVYIENEDFGSPTAHF